MVVDETGSAPRATSLGRNPHVEEGKAFNSLQAGVRVIAWSLFQPGYQRLLTSSPL